MPAIPLYNPPSLPLPSPVCTAAAPHSPTCKTPPPPSPTALSRRALLRSLLLLIPVPFLPPPATAICGDPDPFFAHFIDWTDDLTPPKPAQSHRVHYRCLGSSAKERKAQKLPVLYIGDAGVAMQVAEPLEYLASTDRRIVYFDMLGVGMSESRGALERGEMMQAAAEEAQSVMKAVGLPTEGSVHVVAAGFGLEVAEGLIGQKDGMKVASVVAEGWQRIGGQVTMEDMVGGRVCSQEAAAGGDLQLVRTVYGRGEWSDVVGRIAGRVPTLALRGEGTGVGGQVEERQVAGGGRLPHLGKTEAALAEMDTFFERVEARG